jgi:hypothetical protein
MNAWQGFSRFWFEKFLVGLLIKLASFILAQDFVLEDNCWLPIQTVSIFIVFSRNKGSNDL